MVDFQDRSAASLSTVHEGSLSPAPASNVSRATSRPPAPPALDFYALSGGYQHQCVVFWICAVAIVCRIAEDYVSNTVI